MTSENDNEKRIASEPMSDSERAVWESVGADFTPPSLWRRLRRRVLFTYRGWRYHRLHGPGPYPGLDELPPDD